MLVGLAAAAAAALAFGVAAVLQAIATRGTVVRGALDPRLLLALLGSGAFLASVVGNLLGFVLHVVALKHLPLFLAQAVISASVAVTAVLAARVLHERLDPVARVAVVAVCAGLALLGASAAPGADDGGRPGLVGILAVVLAAAAASGGALGRSRARWTAGALGLVAGLGFALVAVSARLLPGLAPSVLLRSPAAWLLVASGGVAIPVYAAAMQRGAVTAAMAAVVMTQTVVPSAVGVLLLGDRVRAGRAPLAVAGFAVAVAAVVVLVRDQPEVPARG